MDHRRDVRLDILIKVIMLDSGISVALIKDYARVINFQATQYSIPHTEKVMYNNG